MKIKDMIKNSINNTESMIIEQKLNSLFYLPPNYKEEIKMLKRQAKLKSSDRYGLHASAMLVSDNEFCYREQVLSLFYKMAQGENIPIRLKRIFEEGNFVGEKWQRLFIRSGLGTVDDMDISRFVDKYDLSYTPDAIINISKKKYVVEIKSQNTFQFKKATSHPSGRKQLRFYMLLEKCKNGFVLVEDKNDQNFKIFPEVYGETFTKDDMLPYIERLEAIQEYKRIFIEEKKPPKRICRDCNTKRAKECNMRDACWNIGIRRVKLNGK